jgi:hypothetical protein
MKHLGGIYNVVIIFTKKMCTLMGKRNILLKKCRYYKQKTEDLSTC